MREAYEFSLGEIQRLIIVDDEKTINDLCNRAFIVFKLNDKKEHCFSRLNFNFLNKDSEELKKYSNHCTALSELFLMKCFCCGETYSYQSIDIFTCEKCRNIDRAMMATKMIKNSLKESTEGLAKNIWEIMLKPFCKKYDVIIEWKRGCALMFFKCLKNNEILYIEDDMMYKIDKILGTNLGISNLYFIVYTVTGGKTRGKYTTEDGFEADEICIK